MVGVNRTQNAPTETHGRRDRAQNATRRETPPSPTATPPLSGEATRVAATGTHRPAASPRAHPRPCRSCNRPNAASRRRTIHDPMKRKNASPRQRGTAPDLRSPSRARTFPISAASFAPPLAHKMPHRTARLKRRSAGRGICRFVKPRCNTGRWLRNGRPLCGSRLELRPAAESRCARTAAAPARCSPQPR